MKTASLESSAPIPSVPLAPVALDDVVQLVRTIRPLLERNKVNHATINFKMAHRKGATSSCLAVSVGLSTILSIAMR